MNSLSLERKAQILACLTEGMSIRATCRVTGAAKGTVIRLIREVGAACEDYQDRWLRDLTCTQIQCDELWTFCLQKNRRVPRDQRHILGKGNVWNYVAICRDCKLIPVWHAGRKSVTDTRTFIADLRSRLTAKIQLSTDAMNAYETAVVRSFTAAEADYGQIDKDYSSPIGQNKSPDTRYSPGHLVSVTKRTIMGDPDEDMICTSHVERVNLTIRMQNRRFTRLTNGFSKRILMHRCSLAITFFHYNFIRKHQSLGGKTPAMAAGITNHVWTLRDMLFAADQCASAA